MTTDADDRLYAQPAQVTLEECVFYHTMDLPGIGLVKGYWDLRGREDEYLGQAAFAGNRVLEVGTSSGALCFHMERKGAQVIAYDLSEEQSWDLVPFPQASLDFYRERQRLVRRVNNSYWLAHRSYRSSAKVVYGSVYEIPPQIGPVDVTTFCCILLHLRDPFLALAKGTRLCRDTVIVVEPFGRLRGLRRAVARIQRLWSGVPVLGAPAIRFLPDWRRQEPTDTWWAFEPEVLQQMLGVLGFQETRLSFHTQRYQEREVTMFTLVAHRTHDVPMLDTLGTL